MKTNHLTTKFLGLAIVGAALAALPAQADLLQSFSASFGGPVGITPDWSTSLTIPKFNPTLGHLNSITFRLSGAIAGSAQSENTSPSSGNDITLNLISTLQLFRPGSTDLANRLVVSTPTEIRTFTASVFDGVTDFAGSSGATFAGLGASKVNKAVFTSDADKALFSGVGNIDLPFTAIGKSKASGGAAVISVFDTLARGDVTVTYNYGPSVPPVPEPRVYGAFGALVCVGLAAFRRRQAAKQA